MAQVGLIPDKKVSIPGTLSQVDSKVTLKSASKQSAVSSGKYMNALKYASVQNALLQAQKKSVVQTNAQDIFTTNSSYNTSYREPLSLQKGIEAYDQLNLLFEQNSFNLNSTLDFYQKSPLSNYFGEKINQSNASLFPIETGLQKFQDKILVSPIKNQVISEYLSRSLQPKSSGTLLGSGMDSYVKSLDAFPFLTHKISILTSKSTTSLIPPALVNPLKDFYSNLT